MYGIRHTANTCRNVPIGETVARAKRGLASLFFFSFLFGVVDNDDNKHTQTQVPHFSWNNNRIEASGKKILWQHPSLQNHKQNKSL